MTNRPFYIHPTSEVTADVQIGAGTHIGNQLQVRELAKSVGRSLRPWSNMELRLEPVLLFSVACIPTSLLSLGQAQG